MTRPIPCPFALGFLAALSSGCTRTPPEAKEPPPAAVSVTEPTSRPASSASAAQADPIPTLVAEKFAPAGTSPSEVYAVEGGIAVTEGVRVGLVTGEAIRWVGGIPEKGYRKNTIRSVVGRAPDLVAAVYAGGKRRIPQPTFQLLTGKKELIQGFNWMHGPARVGETVFVVTEVGSGPEIIPVHGPRLARHLITRAEAGCDPGEVTWRGKGPAVVPRALESTPAGTMISLGTLCEERSEAAEVWEKDGNTRIVDLGQWWKSGSYASDGSWLLKGEGDELFACPGGWNDVVLRYKDGELSALPELERRIADAFVSPQGQLHASDGKIVYRVERGKWVPAWILPAGVTIRALALDAQGTLWASGGGSVYRLRPGPPAPLDTECPTPFVHLHAAREAEGTLYPAISAALAAFPEAASLGLVEFGSVYSRQVGVTVKNRAQGRALVAYLATEMPGKDPRYFCYEPSNVKRIPLYELGKP